MPAILSAARDAGARFAGFTVLRLPYAVGPLFEDWLGQHFPERKEKVLGRVKELRGGRLYDHRFGSRMRGEGPWAALLRTMFGQTCRRLGLNRRPAAVSTAAFRRPGPAQKTLFE
jgi:DNA repair photolyase